jgi:hypothetical protein
MLEEVRVCVYCFTQQLLQMLSHQRTATLQSITLLLTMCSRDNVLSSSDACAMCDRVLQIAQHMYERVQIEQYNTALKVYTRDRSNGFGKATMVCFCFFEYRLNAFLQLFYWLLDTGHAIDRITVTMLLHSCRHCSFSDIDAVAHFVDDVLLCKNTEVCCVVCYNSCFYLLLQTLQDRNNTASLKSFTPESILNEVKQQTMGDNSQEVCVCIFVMFYIHF